MYSIMHWIPHSGLRVLQLVTFKTDAVGRGMSKKGSVPSVASNLIPMKSSIHFYYQNSRGLKTKTSQFFTSCVSCDFDIICLTETWLNGSVHDSELFSGNFIVYRHDRDMLNSSKSDGGGVLIAVRKNLNSQLVSIPNSQSIESICVKLSSINNNIYLYCLYIPPNSSEICFKNHIAALNFLSNILTDTDNILIN